MLKFNIQNIQNLQFKLFIILCGIVLMILATCLKPACSTNYKNHAKRCKERLVFDDEENDHVCVVYRYLGLKHSG